MNQNHLAFVDSFLRAFVGIKNERIIKHFVRKIARNKCFLWQIRIANREFCLMGPKADSAFDIACKRNAYELIFDGPFSYETPIPLLKEHYTAALIREDGPREFYVFDKDYEWCYVVTHEGDACGPYFFKALNQETKVPAAPEKLIRKKRNE